MRTGGKVSHWLDVGSGGGDDSSFRLKSPRDYDLVDRGTAIRVARGGLYLVYAQVRARRTGGDLSAGPGGSQPISRFPEKHPTLGRVNPQVENICSLNTCKLDASKVSNVSWVPVATPPLTHTTHEDQLCLTTEIAF